MIQAITMLCADGIVRDGQSNNVSVFNIIEQLNVAGFPQVLSKAMFFVLLEKAQEDADTYDPSLQIKMGEEVLYESLVHVDFQDKSRSRMFITIQGLLLPHPGRLEFVLVCDDRELGRYPIAVEAVGSPKITPEVIPQGGESSGGN